MKKYYINYSDDNFKTQQEFALKMAKKKGCFDYTQGFGPSDIDVIFLENNKNILKQPRGGGYWLWKPYIINKMLNTLKEDDYLFYSDSGAFFLKSVDILILELEKYNQDIMCFETIHIESHWTKKELFLAMGCDTDFYRNSNLIKAGFQLIKKTPFSVSFYAELLEYSCNELNITDMLTIKQNHDFIEHRHDQSILSLLYKKHKLRPFKDATQWADDKTNKFPEEYKDVLFGNGKARPVLDYLAYRFSIIGYLKKILKVLGIYSLVRSTYKKIAKSL